MKTILVTGATGFLGHHVVKELLKSNDVFVIAIGGRPEDKANELPKSDMLCFHQLDDLFAESFPRIDVAINCAFARSHDPELLAQAIDFTECMINRFEELGINTVINISSQGVYKRMPQGVLSTEESPLAPIDLYSMCKYATEKMFCLSSIPHIVNVRLASLMMPQRFLYFFVNQVKMGKAFTVTAPRQYAALLDVNDAASGLAAITRLNLEQKVTVYNLGIGCQYSLLEYADSVKTVGNQLGYNVSFEVADNGTEVCAGMDCSKLMKDTGWKPAFLKDEMVLKLYNTLTND